MSGGWRRGFLPPTEIAPFAPLFYAIDAVLTTLIFGGLIYSGIRLLRGGVMAEKTARLVYFCEISYILVYLCILPVVEVMLPHRWRWSVTGIAGLVSLWPQVLTAYPVIGAIAMTLLIRREPRKTETFPTRADC